MHVWEIVKLNVKQKRKGLNIWSPLFVVMLVYIVYRKNKSDRIGEKIIQISHTTPAHTYTHTQQMDIYLV